MVKERRLTIGLVSMLIALLFMSMLFTPVMAQSLSITTSASSSEITTGSSFTLTVTVSNSGSTAQSGITMEIDLTGANGGLSLDATTTKLKEQTSAQTISAGGQISKTWTIYGFSAGTYSNQITINVEQNSQAISGSPKYESVSVKDPAKFTTPAIITTTSVTGTDPFSFKVTTQNSGDYAILNAAASISASGFTVVSSSGTSQASISPDAIFSPSWTLKATSNGEKTVTVTFSSDNAADVIASESITVSGVPTSSNGGVSPGGGGPTDTSTATGETPVSTEPTGEVTSTVTATSADAKASVTIATGIIAKDAAGSPLTAVTVTSPSTLPASAPSGVNYVAGYAYNFGPTGATFSEPVTISITFDTAKFEGKTPVIHVYEAGAWNALATTVVGNKATATVTHFSTFVLFAAEKVEVTPTPTPIVTTTPTVMPTPTLTPPVTTPVKPLWGLIIGIIIAVVIVCAAAYYFYTKKKA